jgi:hypothetical protein
LPDGVNTGVMWINGSMEACGILRVWWDADFSYHNTRRPWEQQAMDEMYAHLRPFGERLRLLPTARFVHISRQPLRVLNSFVQMVLQTAEFESLNPYYALFSPSLLRPSRIVERTLGLRSGFSLYDVGISTVRLVRLVVGRARFTEGVAWLCAHAIRDWSHACDEAHAALPAEIVCHVTFDELMDDPRGTLERLCAFLGTNPRVGSLDRIVPSSPRPFKPMPEVLAVAHILKLPPKTK